MTRLDVTDHLADRTTHLRRLENESLQIFREVAAECRAPVFLYSIGKDSTVMLHLARKAFFPARPPFPLMHVDTGWKFREMIAFRDATVAHLGLNLIVHSNADGLRQGINPFDHGAAYYTHMGQGAHLLVPHGQPGMGPEEPAAGVLAPVQRPHQPGRIDPGVSAVELDRA